MWKPKEIIVNETVSDDPITKYFLDQCPGVPVKHVRSGKAKDIVEASEILRNAGLSMLDKIIAGKQVLSLVGCSRPMDAFRFLPGPKRSIVSVMLDPTAVFPLSFARNE